VSIAAINNKRQRLERDSVDNLYYNGIKGTIKKPMKEKKKK